MISKALTIAAIAATFLACKAGQAQTTATFSTSSQTFNSSLWSFLWTGGNSNSSPLPLIDGTSRTYRAAEFYGNALESLNSFGTFETNIPLTVTLDNGQIFSSEINLTGTNKVQIGPGNYREYTYRLNPSTTIIPIDDNSWIDYEILTSIASSSNNIQYRAVTATTTYRQGTPPRIPEPGAISLLALGGLAMGGMLLRRKSR